MHVAYRASVAVLKLPDPARALRQRIVAVQGMYIHLDVLVLMGLLFGRSVRGHVMSQLVGNKARVLAPATEELWAPQPTWHVDHATGSGGEPAVPAPLLCPR
jgi:hypothetical protein